MTKTIEITEELLKIAAEKVFIGTRTAMVDTDMLEDELSEDLSNLDEDDLNTLVTLLQADLRAIFGQDIDVGFVNLAYIVVMLGWDELKDLPDEN